MGRRKAAVPDAGGSGTGQGVPLADLFLEASAVGALLHIHRQTVRRYVAAGTLPAIKIGKKLLIPALEVEALLTDGKVPVRSWAIRRKGSPHAKA